MLSRRRFFAGLAAAVAVVPVLGPSTLLRQVMIPGVDLRHWMHVFDGGGMLLAGAPFELGAPIHLTAQATGVGTRFEVRDRDGDLVGGGTLGCAGYWTDISMNCTAIVDGSDLLFWGWGNA